ncbi:PAS domain S-box protein [Methanoregula sp.]|uniref:hybrid sensor histidine kinase/response regulator n=1 Tax=Methanoregula sp. TaxID=2052170 RepID=UPI002B8506CD|nr:PAS domain S-box protein [Methanoregula sp.]HVP97117.1 PAS domain S-box protein [Methanoregula sp.]
MIRVLSIDDEPALLDLTRLYLERTGEFSVNVVLSPEEALSLLADHHYDAIISDYQMPGMDGIAFLQELRQSGNTTPFIIFTGKGREEVVIEAINSGADSYLQKGGNPRAQFAELAEKLRQIVRRSRAENALREAEARYRAIFQNASDIIRILDRNGRITYDSPSSLKILGYPPGSLIGKDPMDYIHPEDQDRIKSDLATVYEKKNDHIPSEFRIRRADGSYLWVESVAANLTGVEGVDGVVVTTRPIAERKEAEEQLKRKHEELSAAFEQLTATEEELRQNYNELAASEHRRAESEHMIRTSEAFLKCVISDVREGIIAFDTSLRITLWNPFMEELTGIASGDVVGKDLQMCFPSLKKTDIPLTIERALGGETVETSDVQILLSVKKKNTIWVRGIATPLKGHDGTIQGVIGVVQDITARKDAELALLSTTRELHESEEKYRNVFEAKNDPLILADMETRAILDMNQAAAELYGYSREEMLRMVLLDLSSEPEKTKEALERRVPRVALRYHRKKDGTVFPADIALAYFTLKGRSALILSIRDLTGVQQIGDALRIANVKLNLLIGVTRHDVLNSLTVLLAYNGFLRERENDETTRELLEKEQKALLAIRGQIEFTRAYDDLGIKSPLWQHVGNTAARAFAQFINTISFTCETGDLEIYADPMLEKVFYNLFDNAFRYGEGVTKIRLYGAMDGTDLLLSFEDNGIGVMDNEKARIFSRGIGKNTGLGLFLTREILAITRIGITETGEYRKGARFTMRVPRGAYRLMK